MIDFRTFSSPPKESPYPSAVTPHPTTQVTEELPNWLCHFNFQQPFVSVPMCPRSSQYFFPSLWTLSALNMLLAVGFFVGAFYQIEELFLAGCTLTRKDYCIFVTCFFFVYWYYHVVLFVHYPINRAYCFCLFSCVEPILHSWDEFYLVMVNKQYHVGLG